MGSSGAVRRWSVIVLNTINPTPAAIPATVVEGVSGSVVTARRLKVDLTGYTEWRITGKVTAASSAGAKFAIQWSPDDASWKYIDGVASGSAPGANAYVPMNAAAALPTATTVIPIPVAARGDMYLRCVTLDGDGATTGAMGEVTLQVR